MTTEALTQAVAQWLKDFPHDSDCAHHIPLTTEAVQVLGKALSALPTASEWGPYVPLYNACSCPRRVERLAARVAAAIASGRSGHCCENGMATVEYCPQCKHDEAAVRALTQRETE